MECIIIGVVVILVLTFAAFALAIGSSSQVGKLAQRLDAAERRMNQLDNGRSMVQSRQTEIEQRLERIEERLVKLSHGGTFDESADTVPDEQPATQPPPLPQPEEPITSGEIEVESESETASIEEGTFDVADVTGSTESEETKSVSAFDEPNMESEPTFATGEEDEVQEVDEASIDDMADDAVIADDENGQNRLDDEEGHETGEDKSGSATAADSESANSKSKTSFEERLGARLFVWIGAIALALAGTYLVKYGIEKQVLTPTVRIVLGALFGFTLLGAGEFMRSKSMRIAQGLSAAGIADLFAVTLSATNHHGLLPPMVGFGCMAAVTALAVFLSIRQGWFVAMLGMVGGFLTPALVGVEDQHPAQLFSYLLILEVGLVVVTRKQGWWHLSALTMVAAMGWATKWTLVNLADPANADHTIWLGMFVLGSIAAFVCASLPRDGVDDETDTGGRGIDPSHIVSWVAAITGLALIGRLIHAGNFAAGDWAYIGLLGGGAMVLGRLDRRYLALPWVTCAATLALLVGWHLSADDPTHADDSFRFVTLCISAMYTIGGWCCIWYRRPDNTDTRPAHKPVLWAGLSVMSALAFMLTTYWAVDGLAVFQWWQVSALVGGLFVVAAVPVYRRRDTFAYGNEVVAVLATGAAAFFALAVPLELSRQWITVAWALMVPAIAVIEIRLKVPALRKVVTALTAVVAVRLLLNPGVLTYPMGDTVIWNWLLYGYGVPLMSFALTAWIYNRYSVSLVIAEALESLAIAFGFALATLQIRHGFHGQLADTTAGLHESSTYVITWLAACLGMLWAGRRWQRPIVSIGGKIVGVLALGAALHGGLSTLNPIIAPSDVGQAVGFNLLLFDYALPMVLTGAIALLLMQQRDRIGAIVAWSAMGVFAFAWMTFTVRHGFHRSFDREITTLTEWATYSTTWLGIGVVLLFLSQWLKQTVLRHAATGMLCITALIAMATQLIGRNPLITHEAVNGTLIFNGLLYIYGMPALLSAIMAWRFHRANDALASMLAAGSAFMFSFALITLQIRHGFHGLTFEGQGTLTEWGTYINVWLALAVGLFIVARWKRSEPVYLAASLIGAVSLIFTAIMLGVVHNPMVSQRDVTGWVVINEMAYAYALPAVLFGAIAVWLARYDQKQHGMVAAITAMALTFLWITLTVRHGFHPPNLVGNATLNEHATYAITWLTMGIVMLVAARRWAFKSLLHGGVTVCCLAIGHGLMSLGITENPLRTGQVIRGSIVFNDLLYVYGVPALLAGVTAWQAGKHRDMTLRRFAGIAAILFAFALCSLQVRHAFSAGGLLIITGALSTAEHYAYSATWTVFGVILLVLAIWKRGQVLRYASLVVMMLSVGKVFLFDAGHLENLYRVFSFLGLGVSLLVLAFLYQRFVFRRSV